MIRSSAATRPPLSYEAVDGSLRRCCPNCGRWPVAAPLNGGGGRSAGPVPVITSFRSSGRSGNHREKEQIDDLRIGSVDSVGGAGTRHTDLPAAFCEGPTDRLHPPDSRFVSLFWYAFVPRSRSRQCPGRTRTCAGEAAGKPGFTERGYTLLQCEGMKMPLGLTDWLEERFHGWEWNP